MTRALFEELLFFLIPFVIFALYLVYVKKNPLKHHNWKGFKIWLVVIGLGFAVVAMVYMGLTAPRYQGAFVPPHMENGTLVPGQFK